MTLGEYYEALIWYVATYGWCMAMVALGILACFWAIWNQARASLTRYQARQIRREYRRI